MNEQSFEDAVSRICDKDGNYDAEAYFFLRESLVRTSRELGRDRAPDHNLSAQEVALGFKNHAISEFGPLALLVMTQWGIYETSDIGSMVRHLVDEGVFGKSKADRYSDFDKVYDFYETFAKPYEPLEDRRR